MSRVSTSELRGKVQTVLGVVSPDDLGVTLPHEHLLVDFRIGILPPPPSRSGDLPFTMENLGYIRRFPYSVRGNLLINDPEEMITEVEHFKRAGGGTICELSVVGMRCNTHNPDHLVRISRAAEVNIIHGTGFYLESFLPEEAKLLSVQEMADFMVGEILRGVGGSNVKCGAVYIGCSWPLADSERRSLQAVTLVQKETGVAVAIHPGRNDHSPFEILDILESHGGDLSRFSISHLSRTVTSDEKLLQLARRGCYLNYSLFGKECSHYQHSSSFDMPSDAQKIQKVKLLIDNGYADRVLISHDNVCKHELVCYGGYGYAHILENIVPKMEQRGISRDTAMKILTKNPRNWLTFA